MSDVLLDAVIRHLQDDPTVVSLAGASLYQAHVSRIPQPAYPCVTFSRDTPARKLPRMPVNVGDLVVGHYSVVGFEEAKDLFAAVRNALDNANGVLSGPFAWVLQLRLGPFDSYDTVERPVYGQVAVYGVHQFG